MTPCKDSCLCFWNIGNLATVGCTPHMTEKHLPLCPPSPPWDTYSVVFYSHHVLSSVSLTLRLSFAIYPSFNCCFCFGKFKGKWIFLKHVPLSSGNVKDKSRGWYIEGKMVERALWKWRLFLFNAAEVCVERIPLKTPGPLCSWMLPTWSL